MAPLLQRANSLSESNDDADATLDREQQSFQDKQAYVLVLGDVGRSPRMCNHAVALANVGFSVTLVGYEGSNLNDSVINSPRISICSLTQYPQWMANWFPRLLGLLFKAFWQFITLLCALPFWRGPDFILMQNPPTIPTIVVAYFYTIWSPRTKLVMDWHNYGYSILKMSFGGQEDHLVVRLAKFVESFFGPRVNAAFCVSKAMKRDLYNKWNIDATVLYDRPLATFRPSTIEERHRLMSKLALEYPQLQGVQFTTVDSEEVVRLSPNRPGVLVSSTSWTPDEDFHILFEALNIYESRHETVSSLPDLICVITGKGPLKEYYKKLIEDQNWTHIKVIMPWLEPQEYPTMLGSADLGVCLHTSSSGVDLPMKVVDMFGCGLPVAAKKFQALPELVKDDINGVLFDTSEELAQRIVQWFEDFHSVSYERRRRNFAYHIERFRAAGWPEHWRAVALPVFEELL